MDDIILPKPKETFMPVPHSHSFYVAKAKKNNREMNHARNQTLEAARIQAVEDAISIAGTFTKYHEPQKAEEIFKIIQNLPNVSLINRAKSSKEFAYYFVEYFHSLKDKFDNAKSSDMVAIRDQLTREDSDKLGSQYDVFNDFCKELVKAEVPPCTHFHCTCG